MTEQEDFLSPDHNRLLNIAIWAKYFAWIALGFQILRSALVIFQKQAFYIQLQKTGNGSFAFQDFWEFVRQEPLYYGGDILLGMVDALLKGAVYFLLLKGISLGLFMIVETDINYRENENEEVSQ